MRQHGRGELPTFWDEPWERKRLDCTRGGQDPRDPRSNTVFLNNHEMPVCFLYPVVAGSSATERVSSCPFCPWPFFWLCPFCAG
jgi:hypothetical protein